MDDPRSRQGRFTFSENSHGRSRMKGGSGLPRRTVPVESLRSLDSAYEYDDEGRGMQDGRMDTRADESGGVLFRKIRRVGATCTRRKLMVCCLTLSGLCMLAWRWDIMPWKKFSTSKDVLESTVHVFQNYPLEERSNRRLNRMKAMVSFDSSKPIHHHVLQPHEQREFLQLYGTQCYPSTSNVVLDRYDEMHLQHESQYRIELWKYCALAVHGGAYIDPDSPLFETFPDAFPSGHNYAILGSAFPLTMHGAAIVLQKPNSPVAHGMVCLLVESSGTKLHYNPLLLPKTLYRLVVEEELGLDAATQITPKRYEAKEKWIFLQQRCSVDPIRTANQDNDSQTSSSNSLQVSSSSRSYRPLYQCPAENGYCCEIIHPLTKAVIIATPHPVFPSQKIPPSSALPPPFRYRKGNQSTHDYQDNNLPFISTLSEEVFQKPKDYSDTPNLFDMLLGNDCLPTSLQCNVCLRNKQGADCELCADVCDCYCKALCKVRPEEKFVSKNVIVTPPTYAKDPSRLIPRIVHQTWFEPVTKQKYPNMSRLIESWKRSGWEYRFYDDATAEEFLSTHFPPEVREAYDSITPGAFKADLFRYCTLLINGGVYADMDVMLETNLDAAISPDVGFMTPMDEPGTPTEKRMCLWNGLIAAAPGHPFLARVIENVVNNIRNRFTSVDIDNLLCPDPELSVSHAFDTLFTAGPCILGMSINEAVGRNLQTQYKPGDIDPWEMDRSQAAAAGKPFSIKPDDPRQKIPGRSIILKQNKEDMGAHRFTWVEQNLVVAATDMPDYDDRKKLEGNVHYSEVHVKAGIYGLEKLYKEDFKSKNEVIKIIINGRDMKELKQ